MPGEAFSGPPLRRKANFVHGRAPRTTVDRLNSASFCIRRADVEPSALDGPGNDYAILDLVLIALAAIFVSVDDYEDFPLSYWVRSPACKSAEFEQLVS